LADLPWRRIAWVIAVLVLVGALLYHFIDIEEVHAQAARLPAAAAFALLVFLPLLGLPVSVLHVAAGIRFGGPLGYLLVVLSIGLQLLASYALVHVWRSRFEQSRWLARLRQRIPKGAHASVCAFTVLLPGAPFGAVNYVLPLLGVPLRTLLLVAWPLHALRATVTVAFGDQSDHLTPARLSVLVVYALLILGTSWWLYRRLQSQFSDPPRAAGGRKQPA
jgi:uncharacterized membrane protein YdjX (TVP38/TMEM64 family)